MVEISGLEANALLFAFDRFFLTDEEGKVGAAPPYLGMPKEDLQALRDRLFGAHEHPEEAE